MTETFFAVLGFTTVFSIFLSLGWTIFQFVINFFRKRQERITIMTNKINRTLENMKNENVFWVSLRKLQQITAEPHQLNDWNKAMKYIEENDHRYLFGVKNIKDMDVKVVFTSNPRGKLVELMAGA